MVGIRSRKSKIWLCRQPVWSDPELRHNLLRSPTQVMGSDRRLAHSICVCQVPRRDCTYLDIYLYVQHHHNGLGFAHLVLQHLRLGREIWIQQVNSEALGYGHDQRPGSDGGLWSTFT